MQNYFSHFLDIFNKRNERNINRNGTKAQEYRYVIYIKN